MDPFRAKPSHILIIKTSSLGDIIQSFPVLDYLHALFPTVKIDWVVEASLASIVAAHPLVHRAIAMDLKGLKRSWSAWRKFVCDIRSFWKQSYDAVFDLQRNSKSGLITLLAKSHVKVGFGRKTVREWPNLLATNIRFDVDKQMNIRLQYISLIQKYFKGPAISVFPGVRFTIDEFERRKVQAILKHLSHPMKVMVCPGSKWINKQLPLAAMIDFLERVYKKTNASFFFMWGDEVERLFCLDLQKQFLEHSMVVDRLLIPTWQNLMNEMDLIIALDSSALHLCATTKVPSFSLFGPTNPEIFKPMGERHFALRGVCPYGRVFEKACPLLRTCPTGWCIRGLSGEAIYTQFIHWWESLPF